MSGRFRLGIDIGGTFTDLQVVDEVTGAVVALKTPSTPAPEDAVVAGLQALRERHGILPSEIGFFSHGTTIGVNTLLTRTGAKVGVLTTRGFRDVLELRRLRLPKANDFFVAKPVSLVPRRLVREVSERTLSDGRVHTPLVRGDVEAEARALVDSGVAAIAVCFLHAYRNPNHERLAKAWIKELFPDLYVSSSAEVWPQQREYERFLIAVINAYIGERLRTYFQRLSRRIGELGMTCRVFSTKSNGGVMSVDAAADRPVETLLSGPASGVIGAAYVGRMIGDDRLVTLDMGGTSADMAVIQGEVRYGTENTVGDFPVIMPAVDVSAIGAGGGSIAWTDAEGVLKVGPGSAGANPGPACYGRGGDDATVTDAYLAVGILNPANFLGGAMRLDEARAHAALDRLGARLGRGRLETADAILQVANANIYASLLPQLARRGVEAADFSLLAYGSAGPTQGFLLARDLRFRRIVVPPSPGTLCAFGCVVADLRADFVQSVWREFRHLGDAEISAIYARLAGEAKAWLAAERVEVAETYILLSADLCYVGQSFELNVPIPGEAVPSLERLTALFHDRYELVYGYADRAAPLRFLEARAQIVGVTAKRTVQPAAMSTTTALPVGSRRVFDRGVSVEAPVHDRASLGRGTDLSGPIIIEQYDTTMYVPQGFRISVDPWSNIIGESA